MHSELKIVEKKQSLSTFFSQRLDNHNCNGSNIAMTLRC